jgi:uncharacterized protein (TIGR00255 family)
MTLSSMTGYGSAQADCPAGRLTLELKSVNSRFFEFQSRMPDELRWAENTLREAVQKSINRGKVELRLQVTRLASGLAATQINPASLSAALRLSHQIRQDHPEIGPFSVAELLKLPGVIEESELAPNEWGRLLDSLLSEALAAFKDSREREGERLAALITDRLDAIAKRADQAQDLVPQAMAAQQQRLTDRLSDALTAATAAASPAPHHLSNEQRQALEDRIRQEVAVFSLRIDVAEEIERLRSHLQAARQTLTAKRQNPTEGAGKRLDFLAQEMNREANTLGSKSPSVALSAVSIDIKLLIEQIREQAQNLE